jgi:hypothetical protein
MSEDFTVDNSDLVVDELETLKARARQLDIKFHPSIGVDSLREKVNAKITGEDSDAGETVTIKNEKNEHEFRKQKIAEAKKLVRVIVVPMDPLKVQWPGDIFSVSNGVIGTVRHYVPFNNEEGWHLPQVLVNHLKQQKCQIFRMQKNAKGQMIPVSRLINAYAVTELPALTQDELTELARRQVATKSID